jgi:hypothetical protein
MRGEMVLDIQKALLVICAVRCYSRIDRVHSVDHDFIVLMSQLCGPSKFIVTFEDEGQGRFTQKEIDNMVVRDKKGTILYLNLPQKSVVISNHQVRRQ